MDQRTNIPVRDNVPDEIEESGKKPVVRQASDKEFAALLREEITSSLNQFFIVREPLTRLNILSDIYAMLSWYAKKLEVSTGRKFVELAQELTNVHGGFKNNTVLEKVKEAKEPKEEKEKVPTKAEVDEVKLYGLNHGYPRMVLGRNEGKVYSSMSEGGEEAWTRMINTKDVTGYRHHFFGLLEAVRRNDVYPVEHVENNQALT